MTAPQFIAYYKSPLGWLVLEGNDSFIFKVEFDDSLKHPPATPSELPPLALQAMEQMIEYFQGQRRVFDLPVQQTGTDFQQSVWQQLIQIPYGKTISYMELARRMGDTKTIRAAASANGKNQLAIVVPCHRVVGSKNDLVGYAGGLWRKKWLLDHELKIAHGVLTLF